MLSIINTADIFNRRPLVNDNMDCIFSPDDIDNLPQPSDLITKDGLTTVNAHDITIITGTEAARTALFAKMLAATVLTREYPFAPRMTSDLVDGKVLWIDSVNSFQATAQLAKDMKQLCNANASNFRIAALTALGTGQEFYETTRDTIIHAINDFVPHLVIINNLDKLFPYAGHGFAFGFVEYLRDFVAAHDSAVCAIGHNLIGKVKKNDWTSRRNLVSHRLHCLQGRGAVKKGISNHSGLLLQDVPAMPSRLRLHHQRFQLPTASRL